MTSAARPNRTRVAEQKAHGAARRRDRRFAGRPWIEPGAVRTGHRAIERRDRRDQRGPGIPSPVTAVVIAAAIPAARVEAEGLTAPQIVDPAGAKVGLGQGAGERLGHGPEPARRFGRALRGGRSWRGRRFGAGQREEASRLLGDLAELAQPAALADHVEQVAVLGRGGISPTPGGPGTGVRPAQPHEHRPAGRVADVAHRPVATLASTLRQVMAADRLGVAGEAPRQLGSVAGHHATPPMG